MHLKAIKTTSYIYLILVPVIGAALAFGIGHVSYKLYLPIWLLNALLMTLASWCLGLHVVKQNNSDVNKLAITAFFLIIPWILISMFAGLGPPPETAEEWTKTAKEQQVRYFMLVISGVFIAFGFVGLREQLKLNGEYFYSTLSVIAVLLALPLFMINMLYWGFYLTELFKFQTSSNAANFPDWVQPARQLFGLISVTEVALTYLATLLLALSMRRIGWLNFTSGTLYFFFSLLGFAIIILSAFFQETLKIPGFAVSIPAFPFLMPYFIGVNLLRDIGNNKMGTLM
ncbi:hypothetical protein C7N43_05810 [Sphingobacteriales bacterium UPWRP_1]|nr:hypothetical protein C7N43_05810 [Sphingobacteriales bacterium UPWRP_1]